MPPKKNQVSFLQIRPTGNPAALQTSDNAADAFKQVNTILRNVNSAHLAVSTSVAAELTDASGSTAILSGSFNELSSSVSDVSGSLVVFKNVYTNTPIVSGTLLGPTVITSTPSAIPHGLGRLPNGFFVADKDTLGDIYRTAWSSSTITLVTNSTGSVNIKLWIF